MGGCSGAKEILVLGPQMSSNLGIFDFIEARQVILTNPNEFVFHEGLVMDVFVTRLRS